MPDGFAGKPALMYLQMVESILVSAKEEHNKNPFEGMSTVSTSLPPLPQRNNINTPYELSTANSGVPGTGMGHPGNIVVGEGEYEDIFSQLSSLDENAGADLHNIVTQIEDLYQYDFVMPETIQKSRVLTDGFKLSLGEFRSLTEETMVIMRGYVNEIMGIG
jgi:hypothetical protein